MSRCFPFPPPGYERKHRPEEIDSLKEAKRKEKKHKKDQKDKDRSKDKEKGEKDGSDEKHRDKKDRKGKHKDRKEKHRDKKDKDDRGKDKEKSSISEESTVAGKLGEKGPASLRPKGESKDRSNIADEGKVSAPFPGQNGGRPFQNSQPSLENKESKFLQELDRRIRADETSRASSQLPEGLAGLEKSGQETASRSARNSSGTLAEEKMSYNKDKRVDTRKMEAQGVRNEIGGNSTVQNFATFGKSKVDGIPRPEEGNIDSRWEDKEKSKEIGDNKQRDKHKDKDKVGKRVEKEKDRKKKKEEKKNKEKLKVETESKKTDEEKPRDHLANNDLVGVTSNKGTDFLKDVKNSIITDGNIKKRKDMAINGFFLANETRPMKMPRLTPHQSTENGRKLEAYRTPNASASNKHVVPSSVLLDKGERLINGMIEAKKSSSSKPITSSTMISDQLNEGSKVSLHNSSYSNKAPPEPKMEDPIAEATRRPPHPDSKYLNEVLTVPKLGDWSEHDDQDWLFSKQPPSTRMKSESVLVTEQHVWSKAVVIKSADVCAMPYVIPF